MMFPLFLKCFWLYLLIGTSSVDENSAESCPKGHDRDPINSTTFPNNPEVWWHAQRCPSGIAFAWQPAMHPRPRPRRQHPNPRKNKKGAWRPNVTDGNEAAQVDKSNMTPLRCARRASVCFARCSRYGHGVGVRGAWRPEDHAVVERAE